ncbi:aminoglycoside phosphotransferase family protein [Celeribacter indicus]|uniref:Aminoglycoside phosphotransferase domain-containing protein n=1 Tax=Celeribacter indicus TaxID=1208324 RepID=A0A0B5E1E8_9RHOB|nr:aminoglycoside phosphotransferase family protein [Celeribacter indicus]AJE49099.1 hypothetical protein P73_4384 [Celeribacter indicus]SDX55386.1 Phosphotransferase enzyme family protein [Celeribacter indicus]
MSTADPAAPPEDIRVQARRLFGPVTWLPLAGGRSNRLWRARGTSGDYVFKLYDVARANPLFPNDGAAEAHVLSALSGRDLAPRLVTRFDTPAGTCLVYRFLPGRRLGKVTGTAMIALSRLHGVSPPKGLRRLDLRPAALIAQGRNFIAGLETEIARELLASVPSPEDHAPGPAVFLHGDPTPANMIRDGRHVRFVDWQCPALGDPVADLAIALSPAMHQVYGDGPLAEAEEEQVLAAYPDAATRARYRAMRGVFRWRMACYCAWKAAAGEAPYDSAARAEISSAGAPASSRALS